MTIEELRAEMQKANASSGNASRGVKDVKIDYVPAYSTVTADGHTATVLPRATRENQLDVPKKTARPVTFFVGNIDGGGCPVQLDLETANLDVLSKAFGEIGEIVATNPTRQLEGKEASEAAANMLKLAASIPPATRTPQAPPMVALPPRDLDGVVARREFSSPPQEQTVQPPRRRVVFWEVDKRRTEAWYHDVILTDQFAVLVYDLEMKYGTKFSPPVLAADIPLILDIEGPPKILVSVQSLGWHVVVQGMDLCLLPILERASGNELL